MPKVVLKETEKWIFFPRASAEMNEQKKKVTEVFNETFPYLVILQVLTLIPRFNPFKRIQV